MRHPGSRDDQVSGPRRPIPVSPAGTHLASLDDLHLRQYEDAIRAMRQGTWAIDLAPAPPTSPVAALGSELAELARWLQGQFAAAERLQQLSEHVAKGVLLEDVLDRVYTAFKPLLPYNRIGCATLNAEHTTLTARWARTEYPDPHIRTGFSGRIDGSSLGEILATGRPRIINDLEAYGAAHPASASTRAALSEGIRSSLTCPLIADGRQLGFLFFSSFARNTYAQVHQDLFMRVANQLAVLVEKSDLYQRILDLNRELVAAHAQLKTQVAQDPLTGLLNRRAMFEAAEAEGHRARRSRSQVGVLLLDIDHFKAVNDTHGHAAGDAALRRVAEALKSSVRPYDHVGRYGGEEFLLLLPATPLDTAVEVAERVRLAVRSSAVPVGDTELRLTVSCGVAAWNVVKDESVDQAIGRADAALYAAKWGGRDCVRVGEAERAGLRV